MAEENKSHDLTVTDATIYHAAVVASGAAPDEPGQHTAWLERVNSIAVDLHRNAAKVAERMKFLDECTKLHGLCLGATEHAGRGVIGFVAAGKEDKGLTAEQMRSRWLDLRSTNRDAMNDLGIEEFRTVWLNEPEGAALFETAKSAQGKKVVLYKYMEDMQGDSNKGRQVRMCALLEIVGASSAKPSGSSAPAAAPAERAAEPAPAAVDAAPAPAAESAPAPADEPTGDADLDRYTRLMAMSMTDARSVMNAVKKEFELEEPQALAKIKAVIENLAANGEVPSDENKHERKAEHYTIIWHAVVDDLMEPVEAGSF